MRIVDCGVGIVDCRIPFGKKPREEGGLNASFRRFKDDANVLDQCVTMIEDTIHDIEEYVNKDERKTESLTETLSHLMDVYSEMVTFSPAL